MKKIFLSHLRTVRRAILSLGASRKEKYNFSLKGFVNGADSFVIYAVANMVERRGELTITAYCSDSTVRSQTLNLAGDTVLSLLEQLLLLPVPISANILLNDMIQSGDLSYQLSASNPSFC